MKTLNKFLNSFLNVLFSAYGIAEQKNYQYDLPSLFGIFAIFKSTDGGTVFTEVPNTRFVAFYNQTTTIKGTVSLNANDRVAVKNVSGSPQDLLSTGASQSATVNMNKLN